MNASPQQLQLCERYGAMPEALAAGSVVGWAANAVTGAVPLNGLRHPPRNGACGWYLWGGTEWSDADDFFAPLCVEHLAERCPEVEPFLALPPGWRFLIAPGYVDVWFDAELLNEQP